MRQGVISVVKSGKETELEWKINNFSLRVVSESYKSPSFKFEGESWWLELYPYYTNNGYMDMDVSLIRSKIGSPIEVEFSVSVKTTEGTKSFERRERHCFDGCRFYDIKQWIGRSEFMNWQREFLSSGCPTILLTMMKKAGSGESESAMAADASFIKDCQQEDKVSLDHECQISNAKVASVAEVCSCCKESRRGESLQKIPVHKKCLDQPIMCPKCAKIVSWQNWFVHECQATNPKTASAASACSCCKGSIRGDKISFHKDCLNKETKCPSCDEVFSLQNYFDHACQTANVPGESGALQSSEPHPKDNIARDFKKLFSNQENCDVVLRVQGQKFSAHQAILTARSPVFASTFRCNMKEKETGTVDIEDIDPSCFPEFLCFLYCGEIEKLSAENVRSLFIAADKYQILDLRAICLEFMKTKLCVDTFCDTLVLALLHTETEVINSCTDYFIRNAEEIIETVQWLTFVDENPTQSNELFIKYVKSTKKSNK